MKLYERRWYVYGAKADDPTVKVYALDRVQGVEHTAIRFDLPDGFDPQEHLRHSIGIEKYPDIEPCKIVIKSFAPEYLRALPLHHSQIEVPSTRSEYSIFMYYLAPTPEFFWEILRHGDRVQIASPKEVKEKMVEIVDKIRNNYK